MSNFQVERHLIEHPGMFVIEVFAIQYVLHPTYQLHYCMVFAMSYKYNFHRLDGMCRTISTSLISECVWTFCVRT